MPKVNLRMQNAIRLKKKDVKMNVLLPPQGFTDTLMRIYGNTNSINLMTRAVSQLEFGRVWHW